MPVGCGAGLISLSKLAAWDLVLRVSLDALSAPCGMDVGAGKVSLLFGLLCHDSVSPSLLPAPDFRLLWEGRRCEVVSRRYVLAALVDSACLRAEPTRPSPLSHRHRRQPTSSSHMGRGQKGTPTPYRVLVLENPRLSVSKRGSLQAPGSARSPCQSKRDGLFFCNMSHGLRELGAIFGNVALFGWAAAAVRLTAPKCASRRPTPHTIPRSPHLTPSLVGAPGQWPLIKEKGRVALTFCYTPTPAFAQPCRPKRDTGPPVFDDGLPCYRPVAPEDSLSPSALSRFGSHT